MQYRKLHIDYTEDCGPNEGGYFCQVYRESDEKQIDEFCIHPGELVGIADPEDFIQSYIDDMYDAYRREGLLDEQAILRHLGEKDGITLRIYTRQVTPTEEKRIIQNAANKNRLNSSNTNDLQQTVTAESNLQDVATLVATMHRNREPLLHCAVYIELTASDYNTLKLLQTDVLTELVRSKLNVDKLLLRQQQGFRCVSPSGHNAFGTQFERVLPASSVANLYPFNYSGKLDGKGFYIGKDKYGSNILVDFDQRDEDKTSANILILGNSGQGKSYLMKLLILNLLESGKSVITLDAEHEQQEMCEAVGGCFADLMAGQYIMGTMCQSSTCVTPPGRTAIIC